MSLFIILWYNIMNKSPFKKASSFPQENHSSANDTVSFTGLNQCLTDEIPLQDRESIRLNDFLTYVQEYSMKAVHLLPVDLMIKQKILQDIGIKPYDV